MEKTVKIEWEGKEVDITLRSLTYGEYKKIKRKSIVVKEVNGKNLEFRDIELYDELFILTSIVSAPFELIKSNLEKLSIRDGQLLEQTAEELNFPK